MENDTGDLIPIKKFFCGENVNAPKYILGTRNFKTRLYLALLLICIPLLILQLFIIFSASGLLQKQCIAIAVTAFILGIFFLCQFLSAGHCVLDVQNRQIIICKGNFENTISFDDLLGIAVDGSTKGKTTYYYIMFVLKNGEKYWISDYINNMDAWLQGSDQGFFDVEDANGVGKQLSNTLQITFYEGRDGYRTWVSRDVNDEWNAKYTPMSTPGIFITMFALLIAPLLIASYGVFGDHVHGLSVSIVACGLFIAIKNNN